MARRTSYRARETGLGPQIAGGLMFLAVVLGVGFFRSSPIGNLVSGIATPTFAGHVERVVDGDTFYMAGQDVRIRVWGLDAPETGSAGGSAATSAMSRLVSGQYLTCKKRDIDKYGRIVGQCSLPDGRDITAEMIASGTAREYCYFSGNHYRTC